MIFLENWLLSGIYEPICVVQGRNLNCEAARRHQVSKVMTGGYVMLIDAQWACCRRHPKDGTT